MAHPSPNGQAWDSDKNDKKVGYGPDMLTDTGRVYEHKEWKGKGSDGKKEDGVEALLEMQESDIVKEDTAVQQEAFSEEEGVAVANPGIMIALGAGADAAFSEEEGVAEANPVNCSD